MISYSVMLTLDQVEMLRGDERNSLALAIAVLYPDILSRAATRTAPEEHDVRIARACWHLVTLWRRLQHELRDLIERRRLIAPDKLTGELLVHLKLLDFRKVATYTEVHLIVRDLLDRQEETSPLPYDLDPILQYIDDVRNMLSKSLASCEGPPTIRENINWSEIF